MVADILSTDLTTQYVIGPTTFVTLMPGVSLAVEATTDPGFLASHDQSCTLTVLGTVVTFGTSAQIGATATATALAAVTVGDTGLVQSLTGYGIEMRRSGSVIDNDGTISGGNAGVRYAAGVIGADLTNSGTISSLLGSGIAVIGAAGGSLQSASRTMMVRQAPADKITEAFGLYALAGKATSFLAPFLVGTVTAATALLLMKQKPPALSVEA